MSTPHIAVIDPAAVRPELDCFNRMSLSSSIKLTYHLPGLFGTSSVERESEGLKGILVLGSATSVHDRLPWQKDLSAWLLPKMKSSIPTLGICFGHQLIAHLFGAKVEFMFEDKKKLQGFREIAFAKSRAWSAATGSLFVSHREAVTSLPNGFHVVASSSATPFEALEHDTLPIWTTQSHPEVTPLAVKNMGCAEIFEDERYGFGHGLLKEFIERCSR